MNIVYIRAAVEAATGVKMKYLDLLKMLVEEGMISKSQARNMLIPDLNRYGSSYSKTGKLFYTEHIPVDKVITDWPSIYIGKTEIE